MSLLRTFHFYPKDRPLLVRWPFTSASWAMTLILARKIVSYHSGSSTLMQMTIQFESPSSLCTVQIGLFYVNNKRQNGNSMKHDSIFQVSRTRWWSWSSLINRRAKFKLLILPSEATSSPDKPRCLKNKYDFEWLHTRIAIFAFLSKSIGPNYL